MTSSETIKPMMVKMKPTQRSYVLMYLPPEIVVGTAMPILRAVVTDRFDRATFHRFLAKTFFLRRFRLLVDIRVTAVVVPLEVGGRCFPAQITVDALFIDVEFASSVFGIFVGDISHICSVEGAGS